MTLSVTSVRIRLCLSCHFIPKHYISCAGLLTLLGLPNWPSEGSRSLRRCLNGSCCAAPCDSAVEVPQAAWAFTLLPRSFVSPRQTTGRSPPTPAPTGAVDCGCVGHLPG